MVDVSLFDFVLWINPCARERNESPSLKAFGFLLKQNGSLWGKTAESLQPERFQVCSMEVLDGSH